MRRERAEEIAKILGDAKKWHSHGRGIPMRELVSEDIKLRIIDFGLDNQLSAKVRNYHGLAVDYYHNRIGVQGFIHWKQGARPVA